MKKLVVDQDTCIGCGTCSALAPSVFKMEDNGKADVIDQNADTPENIQNTINSCPVQAIKWEDK